MQGGRTGLQQTKEEDVHLPKLFHASCIEPSTWGCSSPRVRLSFVFAIVLVSCYHGVCTSEEIKLNRGNLNFSLEYKRFQNAFFAVPHT
jgi:hypothetical protein